MSAGLDATRSGDPAAPVAPPSLPVTPSAGVRQRLPALRYCAGVYLAVRVALYLLSATAWGLDGHSELIGNAHAHNGWLNTITSWSRLDTGYFVGIARTWYPGRNVAAAFYPGYPLLIRAASYLCFGNMLAAALLVSNGALLGALVVLYRLTEREFDGPTARRAVLYLCIFPTAFFLFDAYSESVFLLATVGAFALARNRRWGWAALAGLAAAITRSTGVIVAVALAAEAIQQTREDRQPGPGGSGWRTLVPRAAGRLAASAVPLAGTAGWLLFWQLRIHDWAFPLQVEKSNWDRQFSLPWTTLWRGLYLAIWNGPLADRAWPTYDFVLVVIGLALGVWVAARCRPVYAVYCWGSILFFLASVLPARPLTSDPRYLVVIFPLMWALARVGRNPRGHEAIIALSSASLAISGWLFLTTIQVY